MSHLSSIHQSIEKKNSIGTALSLARNLFSHVRMLKGRRLTLAPAVRQALRPSAQDDEATVGDGEEEGDVDGRCKEGREAL
jgi:hypothetical protein